MYKLLLVLTVAVLAMAQDPAPEAPPAAAPAAAAAADAAPGADAAKACGECPVVVIQQYQAKNCVPVMDEAVDKCCPSSYDCSTEEERGVPLDSCYYQNVTYAVGAEVPIEGPCRRSCICRKALDPKQPAAVECAVVECPSLFAPPKPGCRAEFSLDQCCPVAQECSEIIPQSEVIQNDNITIRAADCLSEGFRYFLGDKMLFGKSPCQYCICTKEFSGAYGPHCTKVDCGLEYKNRIQLRNGCVPLYTSGVCCNTDWICPGSPQILVDVDYLANATAPELVTERSHCTFGDFVVPRGSFLNTYNCQVNCGCSLPPEITCIHYPTCDIALSAKKAGHLF